MKISTTILMLLLTLSACKPTAQIGTMATVETNVMAVEVITYVHEHSRFFNGRFIIRANMYPSDHDSHTLIEGEKYIYENDIAEFYRNIESSTYSNNLRSAELCDIINENAVARGLSSNFIERVDVEITKEGMQLGKERLQ